MLIDDDIDEHDLFKLQLEAYNNSFEILSAYNGNHAFTMLEKTAPDYIFLDINMPGMNGLQVLEKLKDQEKLKEIPVFMYSTSDGYRSRKPALRLGALRYFQKPADIEGLQTIFKKVFEDNKA